MTRIAADDPRYAMGWRTGCAMHRCGSCYTYRYTSYAPTTPNLQIVSNSHRDYYWQSNRGLKLATSPVKWGWIGGLPEQEGYPTDFEWLEWVELPERKNESVNGELAGASNKPRCPIFCDC